MTDIWSGDIVLLDTTIVKDIILASQSTTTPLPLSKSIRFLSTVFTARIPLYLAAGPSLAVYTTSPETQSWFESLLLSNAASILDNAEDTPGWWTFARAQSPIGILVSADTDKDAGEGPGITEILFYGTIATPSERSLPTPPSSSPEHPHAEENLPELRVHALPLSSDLLYQPALLNPQPPHPPTTPQFLPSRSTPTAPTPSSPKRKHFDIFDTAALAQKKARRKGGAGIAAAAAAATARANDTQTLISHRRSISISTTGSFDARTLERRPASAGGPLSSRRLSRSPSISSETGPVVGGLGVGVGGKKMVVRSGLSRVATVSTVGVKEEGKEVAEKQEEPTLETRNKEALSRVVLAAMRMHGYQQRKKPNSTSTSTSPDEAAKDTEFKLLYHTTYKSAAFAFRQAIATKPLHLRPEGLRDVVERLLGIFCSDPLGEEGLEDGMVGETPGVNEGSGVGGYFDLPSGKRRLEGERKDGVGTGSPVARRKGGEGGEGMMG